MAHAILTTLRSLVVAFQFLTRIPLPISVPFDREHAARSVVFFPLSGAAIGLAAAFVMYVLQHLLPSMPAAVIILAIWTALSGGLHLDGWMDTADGVLSHRPRERMLEIMRDSRVGAMGVIAGVLLLLAKFAAIASLLDANVGAGWMAVLACIPVWSRWWMTAAIAGWPYARSGTQGGMGELFQDVRSSHVTASAVTAILLTLLALWYSGGPGVPPVLVWYVILLPVMTAALGLLLGWWLSRKLGGQTGDTYGAMNEWVEAGLLLVLSGMAGG